MTRPPNVPWIDNCAACKMQGSKVFCGLSGERLQRFEALTQTNLLPKGAVIFLEEDAPRGIHIICSGKVKLSATNPEGKRVILSLAEPGDILGARALLIGNNYDMTAETLEPSQIRYVRKEDFLKFLSDNGDVCLRLACELSGELYRAYDQMRHLALRDSSVERMVHLLTDLAAQGQETAGGVKLGIALSREELGEMIGASRETASRILADLERKKIIKSEGKRITILDQGRLRNEASGA